MPTALAACLGEQVSSLQEELLALGGGEEGRAHDAPPTAKGSTRRASSMRLAADLDDLAGGVDAASPLEVVQEVALLVGRQAKCLARPHWGIC
jgi:hypothetical protein